MEKHIIKADVRALICAALICCGLSFWIGQYNGKWATVREYQDASVQITAVHQDNNDSAGSYFIGTVTLKTTDPEIGTKPWFSPATDLEWQEACYNLAKKPEGFIGRTHTKFCPDIKHQFFFVPKKHGAEDQQRKPLRRNLSGPFHVSL